MIKKSLIIVAVSVVAATATAKQNELGLNRKENQERRINSGVNTGALTAAEAQKLKDEQLAIKQMRQVYKASGGKVSESERKALQELRDQASKHIRNQKHDKNTVDGSVADTAGKIRHRVKDGKEDGELTNREAGKLREMRDEYQFLRRGLAHDEDGITDEDADVLAERQKAILEEIKKQKHDKQVAK